MGKEIQTQLLFAPYEEGSVPHQLDAGAVSDLFACPTTGKLFSGATMITETSHRSSRSSAKQFFCPVCERSVLRISSDAMRCPNCHWDARESGVSNVAELLERDSDPFPEVSRVFKELTRRLAGEERTAAVAERDGLNMSKVRSHKTLSEHMASLDIESSEGVSFTKIQAEKEKRVFNMSNDDDIAELTVRHGHEDAHDKLLGNIVMEEMTTREERVANGFWWKRDGCARRRIRERRVVLKSPFSGEVVCADAGRGRTDRQRWGEWNCATFLPKMAVEICHDESYARVHVKNIKACIMEVCIWKVKGREADRSRDGADATLEVEALGEGEVRINDIVWENSGGIWGGQVVIMDATVRFWSGDKDGMDSCANAMKHEWSYRIFGQY